MRITTPIPPGTTHNPSEASQILSSYGIGHTAETYGGNHVNRIDERLTGKVLPFFSARLAFE